jgi:hypothetical protein
MMLDDRRPAASPPRGAAEAEVGATTLPMTPPRPPTEAQLERAVRRLTAKRDRQKKALGETSLALSAAEGQLATLRLAR